MKSKDSQQLIILIEYMFNTLEICTNLTTNEIYDKYNSNINNYLTKKSKLLIQALY